MRRRTRRDTELNSKLDDTDWITLATDGSGYLKYRVKNGICTVVVNAGNSSSTFKTTSGGYKKIGQLPVGCRPPLEVSASLSWRSSTQTTIVLLVDVDGNISVYAASTSSSYYSGEIVFPV